MNMTTEQRFERIEELQERQTVSMINLTQAMSQLTDRLSTLALTITRQSEAADLRMTRIEENLDGLIRAITADHKNGKGKH